LNHNFISRLHKLFLKLHPFHSLIALILVIAVTAIDSRLSPLFFFLIFIIGGILVCNFFHFSLRESAKRIFLTIFSFNIIITIFIYADLNFNKGGVYFGNDDEDYERYAYEALESGFFEYVTIINYFSKKGYGDSSYYYTALVGAMHGLVLKIGLEPHTINPRFLNSFVMGFIGVVAWLFAHLIGLKERTSQLAGYLIGFWPLFVFHSAIIRRDTVFAFLLFLSMYLFASFLDRRTKNSVVKISLFLFSVISVCLLRYGFWAIYMFLFGILLFIKSFDLKLSTRSFLMVVILFAGLIGSSGSDFFNQNFDRSYFELIDKYNYYVNYQSSSSSGVGASLFKLNSWISIPARLVYGSVYPPPIPQTFFSSNIRWLGTVPWFLFFGVLINICYLTIRKNFLYSFNLKVLVYSFLTFYLVINLISFTETQQLMYFPFAIVIILYGIEKNWEKTKSLINVNFLIGLFFTLLYAGLKVIS